MNAAVAISLVTDGPVAVVTLARPPVNAIDEAWLTALEHALEGAQRSGAAVLLLRSSVRAFSAGADLALMRQRFESAPGRERMVAFVREFQRVYARLERLPLATIAEIGGAAMGGGLELALACDFRVAAEGASLGLPEARLGLLPGAGGTQRLRRIAGEAIAKRLILRGEVVKGAEAQALGIVHWAVPADALASRARALAGELGAVPAAALAACKRCIDAPLEGLDGFEAEVQGTADLLANPQTQALVRAFLDKPR